MRQFVLIFFYCYPFFTMAQSNSDNKYIKWELASSWEAVKAKARAENKYIFMDCYATWCIPCKQMDEKVFTDQSVIYAANASFISIKVQMDSTKNDNEQIKHWYKDANLIASKYEVSGVPTYLFFSPDGNFIHRGNGYMKPREFAAMMALARAPEKELMLTLYERYQQGKKIKDYSKLMKLAQFTWAYKKNKDTAYRMAKICNDNYLKKIDLRSLYTKENLRFIISFPLLIQSNDRIFKLCYNDPFLFDSIGGFSGKAKEVVQYVIMREELDDKLLKDGKRQIEHPDWAELQKNIIAKYSRAEFEKYWFSDYKINYYTKEKINWRLWAQAKNEKLNLFPPDLNNYRESWRLGGDLNQFGAWLAFLECNDTVVLNDALKWIDIALKLNIYYPPYIDTKANLLYKLGRKEEAIKLEEVAVALCRIPENNWAYDEYKATIEKMKKGVITWLPDPK